MRILRPLQLAFQKVSAALTVDQHFDRLNGSLIFGTPTFTKAGQHITPDSAVTLAAYFACMRVIAEDLAKMPLHLFRRTATGKDRAIGDPRFEILHSYPGETLTKQVWVETQTSWAEGWGNGVARILTNAMGQLVGFEPIHPCHLRFEKDRTNGQLVYIVNHGRPNEVRLSADEVIHVRGLGETQIGFPISAVARESLGLGMSQQQFAASFFGNGSRPSGVITHPNKPTPEAVANIRDSWNRNQSGIENSNKVAIMAEGMDWKPISIPMNEAQFLESREFQVEEVARWFRVPPHKIQHLQRSTFSNIESQNIEYVVDTLQPWVRRWENELNLKLFRGTDFFVEFEMDGLLRGDSRGRAQFYTRMFGIGSITQNEIRRRENLPDIGDAGDVTYVPANMIPSDQAVDGPQNNTGKEFNQNTEEDNERAIAALRRVMENNASLLVRKEAKAAAGAAAKKNGNFADWLESFYLKHEPQLVDGLLTVTEGVIEVSRPQCRSAEKILRSIAASYCTNSRQILTDAHASGTVSEIVGTWEEHRPPWLADQIFGAVDVVLSEPEAAAPDGAYADDEHGNLYRRVDGKWVLVEKDEAQA